MPVKRDQPPEMDPKWLQRSLDRHYAWGLVFMTVLLVAFPLYRLREPTLRSDAKADLQASSVATGSELFAKNCASCHGEGANGGQTAPTLHSKQFLGSTTDQQIAFLVTGGVPGSSMTAWGLDYGGPMTQQQIKDVVAYLRSLEQSAPSVPDWRKGVKAG